MYLVQDEDVMKNIYQTDKIRTALQGIYRNTAVLLLTQIRVYSITA